MTTAPPIASIEDAAALFRRLIPTKDREHVGAIVTTRERKVIGYALAGAPAPDTLGRLYRDVIGIPRAEIIVCHYHPQNIPEPLDGDDMIVLLCAGALGLRVRDYVLMSPTEHVSTIEAQGL